MEHIDYIDYGYCRISTPKQNIDRQERNILQRFPRAHIVKETYTGTKTQGRSKWIGLYKAAVASSQNQNTRVRIVFDSVSRFSRNADEGCELYEDLFNRGITLVFLKEPHINTDVYRKALEHQIDVKLNTGDKATDEFVNNIVAALNKYTIDLAKAQIRIAFEQAEKEVVDLQQRTSEGLKTAKMNGKQIGTPKGAKLVTKKSVAAKAGILKYNKSFGGALNDMETVRLLNISRKSFYKYKRELLETLKVDNEESRGI